MARQSFPERELAVLHLSKMQIADFKLQIVSSTALLLVSGATAVFTQESPTPSPTPMLSATPEETSSPPPSATPARNVQLRFVPPPMEGTISLGVFDSNGKLVRVLHREATIDAFKIDENSLNTTWDGKNDAGEDSPPGKYRARGYMVANLKVEDLGKVDSPPSDT